MEENYFATSRNGHELKNMYNPETNTLDIRSNGLYPSIVLSNLCSNGFRLDGMVCGSMEGFLQSLKRQDINKGHTRTYFHCIYFPQNIYHIHISMRQQSLRYSSYSLT